MSETAESMEQDGTDIRTAQLGPKQVEIPTNWRVRRLGEVVESAHRGKQPKYDIESNVPVLNQSCIRWNGFDESEVRYLDEEAADSWKNKYFVDEGDVLLNSTGRGTLGRAIVWEEESGRYGFDSCITKIEVSGEILPQYLKYYFESDHGQQTLLAFCEEGSTGQTSISKADLLSTPVLCPPVEEQKKMVEALHGVEKQLRWSSKAVFLTQDILEGVRSRLISGGEHSGPTKQIRLGPKKRQIPDDWDVVQLSEIAELETGATPKRSKESYWESGSIPWVKSGELNDRELATTEEKITERALNETGCTVFPEGTLLIALYGKGTVTKTARLEIAAATNQAIAAIFPKSEQVTEEYLQQYLIHMRNFILNVIVNPSSDTGRTNMYLGSLRSLKVVLPPLNEQKNILLEIREASNRLRLEEKREICLDDIKRGLLNDILSGTRQLGMNGHE